MTRNFFFIVIVIGWLLMNLARNPLALNPGALLTGIARRSKRGISTDRMPVLIFASTSSE